MTAQTPQAQRAPYSNDPGREADLFVPGRSWALCFFLGQDPQVQEFRPPQSGFLANQFVAVYVPYETLFAFTYRWTNSVPALRNPSGHCRLIIMTCDNAGKPREPLFTYTIYARNALEYHNGYFKFVGDLTELAIQGQFYPGTYFIYCEFYKGAVETDLPDAMYTTGIIELF
ncbi:hypothetical protein NUW58_g4936 [Xylaria curta]|uniref:Uncharacterized protein n=1 Tax=Xylaria curta TaxID=42375 RepID=A0ACC1P4X8_9PEZI|nr:hypothetical protein NUW58_g4936 [Xylaria curta]